MSLNRHLINILLLSTFCSGCSNSPDQDVVNFVETTKKKESKLQNLPAFKNPKPRFYEGKNMRDPFSNKNVLKITQVAKSTKTLSAVYTGPSPDLKRKREPLELVTLDSLTMVGFLSKQNKNWALLRDSEKIIHRVGVGNYLGPNYGKIKKITDKTIEIEEFVSNGEGGWRQKMSFIKIK